MTRLFGLSIGFLIVAAAAAQDRSGPPMGGVAGTRSIVAPDRPAGGMTISGAADSIEQVPLLSGPGAELATLRTLADLQTLVSAEDSMATLEKITVLLHKESERLLKEHHQSAAVLLKVEKVKAELANVRVQIGEMSRRLHHNTTTQASPKAVASTWVEFFGGEVTTLTAQGGGALPQRQVKFFRVAELVQMPQRPSSIGQPQDLSLALGSGPTAIDIVAFLGERVRGALGARDEAAGVKALEDLMEALRGKRDTLLKSHHQAAGKLAELRQTQAALGRAHLDCGLLGRVLQARKEHDRLVAELAAGRAREADLAAARAALASAEKRWAAEGSYHR